MKNNIRQVDYLTKDYEGFRSLMLDLIPSYTPEWTDTNRSDFGVVLIELLAYALDILSFYQDRAIQESFIDTAQNKKSIISLCRLLGYELTPPSPAKTTIIFKKYEDFIDQEIKIPKGTKIGTNSEIEGEQIIFELDNELVIPAGYLGNETDEQGNYLFKVTATHGETITEDIIGVGNNQSNQKYKLSYSNALLDSIEITTNENGIIRNWTRVSDFLASNPTSRHYIAYYDENDDVIIEFGDGVTGMKVPSEANIIARYRVGGGTKGNVGANTLVEFVEDTIIGIESISNPNGVDVEGTDMESIEHAKEVAPRIFRTMGRAVTRQDYEDIVLLLPEVAKAKAKETFNANRDLYVYIVPSKYEISSQELLDYVKSYLDEVKNVADNVIVQFANYVNYNLEINIQVSNTYDANVVKNKVIEVLHDALDMKNFDIGESIPLAYIFREVMLVDGVKNVQIVTPTNDLTCQENEILQLNSLTVNVV